MEHLDGRIWTVLTLVLCYADSKCCDKKVVPVGSTTAGTYTLVSSSEPVPGFCIGGCLYTKKEDPRPGTNYCFKEGDEDVSCSGGLGDGAGGVEGWNEEYFEKLLEKKLNKYFEEYFSTLSCCVNPIKTTTPTSAPKKSSTQTITTAASTTTTSQTTKTTTTSPTVLGILIAGGGGPDGPILTTEVYIPETNKICSFPSLPGDREFSTLDTLQGVPVICGHPSSTSCLQLDQVNPSGSWIDFATTTEGRFGATSWVKDDDPANPVLVLIGGRERTSAEIISFDESLLLTYTMPETRDACGIGLSDSTIVTGGLFTGKQVLRYNLTGNNPVDLNLVETLPDLREGRFYHGCGSYTDGQDNTVLIVAGGDSASNYLDSTEKHVIGDTSWAIVQPLPRKLYVLSVFPNIGNKLYLTGGYDDGRQSRDEILVYDGETWEQVGRLKQARDSHAVTKINIDQGVCN